VGLGVVDHRERRIFLVQPQQRLAELDVVLAIVRRQRHRQHRRYRLYASERGRRGLAARERVAGLDRVELAECYGFAGFRRRPLAVVPATDREDAGNAPSFAGRGLQCRAVVEMPGQ
jgi:hypothetical protein